MIQALGNRGAVGPAVPVVAAPYGGYPPPAAAYHAPTGPGYGASHPYGVHHPPPPAHGYGGAGGMSPLEGWRYPPRDLQCYKCGHMGHRALLCTTATGEYKPGFPRPPMGGARPGGEEARVRGEKRRREKEDQEVEREREESKERE